MFLQGDLGYLDLFLPPTNEVFWQGNVFTPVCLSTGEGRCCDATSCYGQYLPPDSIPSPDSTYALDSTSPWISTSPSTAAPLTAPPPRQHLTPQTASLRHPPQGQQAGGTHLTGMLSCLTSASNNLFTYFTT